MPTYNTAVLRTGTLGTDTDPLVPEPLVADVIKEATKLSAVLSQVRTVRMASGTSRQPVLSTKPIAYWGSGDTGLAQTTNQDWENVELVAEPLTAIVRVPKAYMDDSLFDIWDEVRPELAEAIAKKIDAACIFGTDAPSTFGNSIFEAADAVGNSVMQGTYDDLGADVAALGKIIKQQGYAVSGFFAEPGFDFDLYGIRSADGMPIYQPLQDAPGGRLLGRAVSEVENGAWGPTESVSAKLIAGDWSKCQLGIRQDITFEVSDQAVISDGNGAIVANLWQSNQVAIKFYARYAWATANPVTALEDSALERSPFGFITPGT